MYEKAYGEGDFHESEMGNASHQERNKGIWEGGAVRNRAKRFQGMVLGKGNKPKSRYPMEPGQRGNWDNPPGNFLQPTRKKKRLGGRIG